MAHTLDLVVKNARVVRPNRNAVDSLDIGIKDGRFARLAPDIRPEEAKQVFDGKGLLAFPGLVDAHMHVGIYQQLDQDAPSESKAAAMGGVTTSLNYMRTGQYYLNRTGSYREFMPEVMRLSRGALLGRLRLPHGADRGPARRRDGAPPRRMGRAVVQDLHVLRRLRAARQVGLAERVPDDRAGGPLRRRPLRVHHALGAAAHGRAPGPRRLHQREPALRVRRHPQRLHEARRARREARRARRVQRRAAAALRRARGLDRRLPRLRDRLPQHQPAAPLVEEGDGRRADDAGSLPAHQLQARGYRRPSPARYRLSRAASTPR